MSARNRSLPVHFVRRRVCQQNRDPEEISGITLCVRGSRRGVFVNRRRNAGVNFEQLDKVILCSTPPIELNDVCDKAALSILVEIGTQAQRRPTCQPGQKIRRRAERIKKRGDTRNIDEILRLAEQRRGLITRSDGLFTALKPLKTQVRTLTPAQRNILNQQIKATTQEIRQLELQVNDIDTRLHLLLLDLPNTPHQSVQASEDSELRSWGQSISWHFGPRAHWELGAKLGIIDAESGALGGTG